MEAEDVSPIDFLLALNRAGVRWLMIGRQAVLHYGAPVQTNDYDLWVDRDPRNLSKLLEVARTVGLEDPGPLKDLAGKAIVMLFGGHLKVDVFLASRMTNLDGETVEFSAAYRHRTQARKRGDPLVIPLPSLEDLRRLKRMRDGAKDREDLRYLDLMKGGKP